MDLTTDKIPSPEPVAPPVHHEQEEDLIQHQQQPEVEPVWNANQRGWAEHNSWRGDNSRSGHSWQGGDRNPPDDWRQRGGRGGGDDWGRNHMPPKWDDEDAQDGWADHRQSSERRWGRNDPRRSRERERRDKGEWRRSQEEPEDSSRWSEEHSRFKVIILMTRYLPS